MYPNLYPHHLNGNIARVDIAGGVARVLYFAGNMRTFQITDEARLVSYLESKQINYVCRQPTPPPVNRCDGSEAGANHPADKPNTKAKLHAKAQASLDKVVEKFKSGDLSAIQRAVRLRLDPDAPANKWTFSNQVLAYAQTDQLDCRGYRQWQQVGRQVKKGEGAAYILRPRLVKKTNKQADGSEEEAQQLIGFAPVAVFAIDQTEGEDLPEYVPHKLPPLSMVAEQLGITVTYQPMVNGTLGSYAPTKDQIRLGTTEEATFFHELAHAIHKRVVGKLKGGQDAHQETVAELSAAVLCDMYFLPDYTGNAWEYIELYAKDPLTAITKALTDVSQILDYLFKRDWLVEAPSGRQSIVTGYYDEAVESGCQAFDCEKGQLKVIGTDFLEEGGQQ